MSFERTLGDFWGTRLGEWSVVRRGELLLSESAKPDLEDRNPAHRWKAKERGDNVGQRAKRAVFSDGSLIRATE